MTKKLFYIKLFGAMVVSFLISGIIVSVVFPTKTPRVRPNLITYVSSTLIRETDKAIDVLKKTIPTITKKNTASPSQDFDSGLISSGDGLVSAKEALNNIPFNSASKGIYTKSDTNFSYILIKEKEVDWEKNGKYLVPKGEMKLDENMIKRILP
jgi:hypothetical protein